MKIAFFHNLPYGGALRTVYEEIKGLSKYGHNIDLYEIQYSNYKDIKRYLNKYYYYSFNIKDFNIPILGRLFIDYQKLILLKRFHKRLASIIDRKRYDIVIVHSDIWTESPYLIRYLKTKNVYVCHELLRIVYEKDLIFNKNVSVVNRYYEDITRRIRKFEDKKNASSADFVITMSNYIKRKVKFAYNISAKTIHSGVDTKIFKNRSEYDNNQILFVGSEDNIKGFDTLLSIENALKLVNKKIQIKKLGYGKNSIYINNDKKMSEYYSKSLCTLCIARSEPFGLIPLESMSCKTPVIAVNEGGYKETVTNKINGFIVKRDPVLITKYIKYFQKNRKQRIALGKNARNFVKKFYTWEIHNKMLHEYLMNINNRT